jgi:inner membrane protein
MQGFNHVAGGLAFTGIFASFGNTNIFEKPEYLAATVVFSVLPDIDHTRSLIGKSVWPLSNWISRKFGHRTITHSLVFFLGLLALFKVLQYLFNLPPQYYTILAFSYGSHLIFDMCTKQGIPLFYPFTKRPAVLPGNPNLRLSTNDIRSEAIVFVVFTALIMFCMPLFANGFWMQYRRYFLNGDNLRREMNEKGRYVILDYEREEQQQQGTLIDITDQNLIIFREGDLHVVPRVGTKLVDFKLADTKIRTETVQLFQVPADSLKKVLAGRSIKQASIQATGKFFVYNGVVIEEVEKVEVKNAYNYTFFENQQRSQGEREVLAIREKIQNTESQYSEQYAKYQAAVRERNRVLSEQAENERLLLTGNDFEKGQAIQKRNSFRVPDEVPPPPRPDHSLEMQEIRLLETQVPTSYSARITFYVL